ncbi:MAG: phosphotransferase, partial [Myxococcales bacterium]|nr:phosphotransferase [Myxococcales bacterium]
MTTQLPQPASEEEFDALDRKDHNFVEAIRDGFEDQIHSLPIEATAVGSYPVFHVGSEYIVKLFAPLHDNYFRTESALLRLLAGNRKVPAPELVATTEIDGWQAVLMTRLRGQSLKEIWPTIDAKQKEALCETLGEITRTLHGFEPGPIRASCLNWDEFFVEQVRECAARQLKHGLSERLARQIPDFLASLSFNNDAHVVLHTEIMLDHVFAEDANDSLQITGLIDFEPAMVGLREYEFASVGLFITQGNARLLRAFMSGYGHEIDAELHRRLMGFALLHRYSKLSWYLQFMPNKNTVEELAASWFGTC